MFRACPYYLAKSLSVGADLILLPYNYLVDPRTRRLNTRSLNLNNAILIFDEAHNVEASCGEACSIELRQEGLQQALQEARLVRELIADPDYLGDLTEERVRQVEAFVYRLSRLVSEAQLHPNEGLLIQPGLNIYSLMTEAMEGSHVKTMMAMIHAMGTTLLMSKRHSGGKELMALDTALKSLYQEMGETTTDEVQPALQPSDSEYYRLVIREEGGSRTLSLWCFSAGIVMRQLKQAGVRSIILASGTLSPLPSLAAELQT